MKLNDQVGERSDHVEEETQIYGNHTGKYTRM